LTALPTTVFELSATPIVSSPTRNSRSSGDKLFGDVELCYLLASVSWGLHGSGQNS